MPNEPEEQPQQTTQSSTRLNELLSRYRVEAPDNLRPEAKELARKMELLRKVRTIRDGTLLNRAKVSGDPTKHYCWVNVKEDRQFYFQAIGFTVCTDPEIKTAIARNADGKYIRGDLILYEIDKEFWQMWEDECVIRGLERIQGAEHSFEYAAQAEGAPVYKPPIHTTGRT